MRKDSTHLNLVPFSPFPIPCRIRVVCTPTLSPPTEMQVGLRRDTTLKTKFGVPEGSPFCWIENITSRQRRGRKPCQNVIPCFNRRLPLNPDQILLFPLIFTRTQESSPGIQSALKKILSLLFFRILHTCLLPRIAPSKTKQRV